MSHKPLVALTFLAGGVIARGQAVKIGADNKHVVAGAGNTDSLIGIAQNAAAAAEDPVEVALPGSGGVALAKETITAGKLLTSNADGALEQTNASGDRFVAMAMEDAVAGDIFSVEVLVGITTKADA